MAQKTHDLEFALKLSLAVELVSEGDVEPYICVSNEEEETSISVPLSSLQVTVFGGPDEDVKIATDAVVKSLKDLIARIEAGGVEEI